MKLARQEHSRVHKTIFATDFRTFLCFLRVNAARREEEEEERCLINRSQEARPTRCRVELARVSSPQVDLTRCGSDKH